MSTPATQPPAPQPARVKKRIYIPVMLLALLMVVALIFYVRGEWADTAAKNPAGPDAGTVTQLLQLPDKNVVVRCAVVVNAPPKDVWAVVSGYAAHKDFLPYVSKVEATPQDGQVLVAGIAHSRLWGDWPFEALTTHKENASEGKFFATWSEEDKDEFKVNRGEWSLTPFDGNNQQTLLAMSLQVELKQHPNFIVRNIIMDRMHYVLKAMRDESLRKHALKS